MLRTIRKQISLLLCLALLAAALPLFAVPARAVVTPYKAGDIVSLGEYPQSRVTDEALLAQLNSALSEWQAYPYSVGNGDYGSMTRQDFTFFQDVTLNGTRYRAVRFQQYRPLFVQDAFPEADVAFQALHGYFRNTTYWFRFDPVEWQVLDPEQGLLISWSILDAQPFTDTVYRDATDDGYGWQGTEFSDPAARIAANSYRSSYIRQWLNETFYETAFTETQRNWIDAKLTVPEDIVTESPVGQATASDASVTDADEKVIPPDPGPDPVGMLSEAQVLREEADAEKEWGYDNAVLRSRPTDYAFSQGFCEYANEWMLCTPGENSGVLTYGYDAVQPTEASFTGTGVRPVISVNFGESFAGDIDGDGKTTSADARLALRTSVSLTMLPPEMIRYADADGDGSVTAADARLILRYSVSLEKESALSHFFLPSRSTAETDRLKKQFVSDSVLGEGKQISLGGAHVRRAGTAFAWTSSNPAVATVSENGTVTALKKGYACIYLTNGSARYYYGINVLNPLQEKIYALQEKYPSGYYWNSYPRSAAHPAVTETPCSDHAAGIYSHCIGQCAGFAALLSDEVFGERAPVRRNLTVSQIRIGDYVRCLPHHSVFVIDRVSKGEVVGYNIYNDTNQTAWEDMITVAECNWDRHCGINWGRTISLDRLSIDSGETYTRY